MNYDHIFKEGNFLQVSGWDLFNNIIRRALYAGKPQKSDYYTGRKKKKKNRKKANKR